MPVQTVPQHRMLGMRYDTRIFLAPLRPFNPSMGIQSADSHCISSIALDMVQRSLAHLQEDNSFLIQETTSTLQYQ